MLALNLISFNLLAQGKINKKEFDSISKLIQKDFIKNPKIAYEKSLQLHKNHFEGIELQIESEMLLAYSCSIIGNAKKAEFHFKESINNSKLNKKDELYVRSVIMYSHTVMGKSSNNESLELLYDALDKNSEEFGDFDGNQINILLLLTGIHVRNNELKLSEEYALKSLDIILNNKEHRNHSVFLTNAYIVLEQINSKKGKYDNAMLFAEKAVESSSYLKPQTKVSSLIVLSRNYLRNNKFAKANERLKEAENIITKNDIFYFKPELHMYFASIQLELGNSEEQFKHLSLSERYSIENMNSHCLREVYLRKCIYYGKSREKDLEEEYYDKFTGLNDSIYADEKNKLKLELDAKYSLSEKSKEIQVKNIYLIVGSIITLLLIILIVFYIKYNKSQKNIYHSKLKYHNENMNALLVSQKYEIVKTMLQAKYLERQKISREIHDGVANNIAEIKMRLSKGNFNSNNVNVILKRVDVIYDELHTLSHKLMPEYFSKIQFSELVSDLSNQLEIKGVSTKLSFHNREMINKLEDEILLNLYRLIQEAFSNIQKHSKANEILVAFILFKGVLDISIEDNGIGFKVNKKYNGLGLKNMYDRIAILNGQLDIKSSNNGTKINIKIALQE